MFSDPVVGKNFFGRSRIMALLAKRIGGLREGYRQNIAIIGPELLGKSSILRHFIFTLNNPEIIPVYVEVETENFNYFAHKFMRALLYHFLTGKTKVINHDIESLLKTSREFIPKTVKAMEKIKEHLRQGERDIAYELLLDLSTVIKKESGKFCVVILDEFHLLAGFVIKEPFSILANKIMFQKDTMYIVASSKPALAKNILSQKISLLFGNFETIELKPFDFKSSARFIRQRLENINISPALEKFLIAFTNGHPFYLNIISVRLRELVKERNSTKISSSLIAEAVDHLMFNSQGILTQYFTNCLEGLGDCAAILLYLANNNKLKDAAKCNGFSRRGFTHSLNRLIGEGVVSKSGSFIEFNDYMLEFWLRSVYQRKHLSLTADVALESKDFQAEIKKIILGFISDSQRSYTDRMQELFKLFSNEVITIEQKRHRLPAFTNVSALTGGESKNGFITAQDGNKYWVFAVSEKELSEEEVIMFIQTVRKNNIKNRKEILIALEGIDINARLLAKQKKIWTWDLNSVNLLLKLYRRSPIVR